jgi:transcriptional regulator ATRX
VEALVSKKISKNWDKYKHQPKAVEFLLNRIIGSKEKLEDGDVGDGAILAYCMGLGKTIISIAVVDIVLSHEALRKYMSRVLIIAPLNTNWEEQFERWAKYEVVVLNKIDRGERYQLIKKWFYQLKKDKKIILVTTYETFVTTLAEPKCQKLLQKRGPDLLIIDEAHKLKNDSIGWYTEIDKIRTNRRILLTGTPLQNNLDEYYNLTKLVDNTIFPTRIIKKGKTKIETAFSRLFTQPIEKGRFINATEKDVMCSKQRAYILGEKTKNIVQREGIKTLNSILKFGKLEATLFVRPTKCQKDLFDAYVNRKDPETNKTAKKSTWRDMHVFSGILTHPKLVGNTDWSHEVQSGADLLDENHSNKLLLTLDIIKRCEKAGDKVLFFSHSLKTLDVIQSYLEKSSDIWFTNNHFAKNKPASKTWEWKDGLDFFRIDSDNKAAARREAIKKFNRSKNKRARLLLISTKAGSLGATITAANRIIIFEPNWNPSDNIQSLFRVYRIGQKKPVFVYRLVTSGTMEETLYKKEIEKESLSRIVVDEEEIDRFFTSDELKNVYKFNVPQYNATRCEVNFQNEANKKNSFLLDMIQEMPQALVTIKSHESLFEKCEDADLTTEEIMAGREDYEKQEREENGIFL